MSKFQYKNTFQTRLARKTFFLFVLSALVPLTLLTYFTYQQFDKQLVDTYKESLRDSAKSYGIAIHDRLLSAATQLDNIDKAQGFILPTEDYYSLDNSVYFESIMVKWSGQSTWLLGSSSGVPELSRLQLEYLQNKPILLVVDDGLWLVKNTSNHQLDRKMFAKLGDYIWGAPEYWDQDKTFEVSTEAGNILFKTHAQNWQGNNPDIGLDESWLLNLAPTFGSGPMMITATSFGAPSAPGTKELNYYIALTAMLAIILVAIISLSYIRRITRSVTQLVSGIDQINENDFSAHVKIDGNDEFSQVGSALNSMAGKLGQQIHAMKSLAEIDQMVLGRVKKEEIISLILERSATSFGSERTVFLIKKEQMDNTFVAFIDQPNKYEKSTDLIVEIPPEIILEVSRDGADDSSITSLLPASIKDYLNDVSEAQVTAITVDDSPQALLITSYDTKPDTNVLAVIKTFADHMAVALTNSEWEKKLFLQAHFDSLTGLPNRHLAMDRLSQAVSVASSTGGRIALFFMDLDEFKTANDSLGHMAGDKLLKIIGDRFYKVVEKRDTLARLGGDEFVLIHYINTEAPEEIVEECEDLAGHLVKLASTPVSIEDNSIISSTSIGVAIFPEDGKDADNLLKNADIAMYHAKEKGKNNYQFYDSRLNEEAEVNLKLVADIHQAIKNNEFELCYQPKIASANNSVCGCEALIRWNHPSRGFLSPLSFIPAAEKHGIISEVGNWVILSAMQQKARWKDEGLAVGIISVNISPKQINRDSFIPFVKKAIKETGMAPGEIEFEITETAFIEDFQVLKETMNALRGLGIDISIDDYGTGYASINLLANLPVQTIKIDASYIAPLPESRRHASIVSSMISLGHSLELSVVAEGVETGEQLELLRSLGCEVIQGYYYSQPLTVEECGQYIINHEHSIPGRCKTAS